MTKALITDKDLYGRLPKNLQITAKTNLSGLIKMRLVNNPAQDALAGLQAAIQRANSRITVDLKAALDEAMLSGVWSTPSGNGDIYDTGELLSSGSVTVGPDGVTIAYDAPYAALVHFGGYINPYGNQAARIYLPPRPWVESVMFGDGPVGEFDFERYYDEEIRREFSG